MAALRLHEEEILAEKVRGFPVLYELKVLKKKMLFKRPARKWPKVYILEKLVILLEQVATENILKIAALK